MAMRSGARARVATMYVLPLLLLLLLSIRTAAESLKSKTKMARSNPVLQVLINGERVNLVLTTDVDGIMICTDLPRGNESVSPKIDFDYARRLLRFQLDGLILQEFAMRNVAVPALAFSGTMPLGYFALKRQWLSPASIEYFLLSSNASGFIGVGFAFRPMHSRFWTMVGDDSDSDDPALLLQPQQYSYRGFDTNSTSKLAALAVRSAISDTKTDDSEDEDDVDLVNGFVSHSSSAEVAKLVWSEPLAPIGGQDDASNTQGISFPIHRAFFRCAPTLAAESSASASLNTPHAAHEVELFGEFSSNWDVTLDFNVPCLVLPHQFFDALAGWTGLRHNDELKLAEISSATLLPDLVFSLSFDGPQLTIPLQQLVLPELELAASPALNASVSTTPTSATLSGTTRVCIQRSGSILQSGAAVFSALDQDAGTVQRYRLHGSLSLPLFNMLQAPVVFGAMVLNTFAEVVVDGVSKQTALRMRSAMAAGATPDPDSDNNSNGDAAFATCMRRAQCTGQQEFIPRLNTCQDPDCSLYYFQSLDATTKRCVVDAGWTQTVVAAVAIFIAAELLFSFTLKRLVAKARATASSFAS